MRSSLRLSSAVAALAIALAAPRWAAAGVMNSNHDMSYKTAGSLKAGACSHCHIPHKAGGSKLWASTYTDVGMTWTTEVISQLCYSCHGVGTPGMALEQNPFAGGNHHARNVQILYTWGDIAGLPPDVPVSADGNLKCTSCHDVHNNERRPFLRFVTSAGFNLPLNCQKCHPGRNNTGLKGTANAVAGYSQHPVNQVLPSNGASLRAFFVTTAAEFSIIPGAQVQVPGTAGWNLGGHRNDALATANSFFGCTTCHAVHGDETDVFTSTTNGATPVASPQMGFNHLTVRRADPLTGAAPPYVAPLCTGCHRNSATAGPGLTGTYTHPIEVSRNGQIFVIDVSGGYKWGGAGNDMLVCQSCHKIHYGKPNTSLLHGNIDAPPNTSNANCGQCHGFGDLTHHPNGPTVVAPAGMASTTRSTGPINWNTLARGPQASTYPWGAGSTLLCSTCHYQRGAHNNTGAFNNLVAYNVNSEMCMDCHTSNPSVYTTVDSGHPGSNTVTIDASHYIGNIVTASYKRILPWATTGLSSKYGSTGTGIGVQGALICESCHSLKMGGLVPGPTWSNNGAGSPGHVNPAVGLLLEVAGNMNNVAALGINSNVADLCTGCHGASPQGGQSAGGQQIHPAISATPPMTAISNATISAKMDAEWLARGTVSKNVVGLINCESCHRAHDAAEGSGALILEGCGTASNKTAGGGVVGVLFDRSTLNGGLRYTEEATFCNLCHNY